MQTMMDIGIALQSSGNEWVVALGFIMIKVATFLSIVKIEYLDMLTDGKFIGGGIMFAAGYVGQVSTVLTSTDFSTLQAFVSSIDYKHILLTLSTWAGIYLGYMTLKLRRKELEEKRRANDLAEKKHERELEKDDQ